MDCQRAAETLSAAFDGELVDAGVLAEARAHCSCCPECQALQAFLERASVPGPQLSEALAGRLEQLAASEARRVREDAAVDEASLLARIAPEPKRQVRTWGRVTAFASVAAVVLVAFAVGTTLVLSQGGGRGSEEAVTDADTMLTSPGGTAPVAPESAEEYGQDRAATAQQAAPAYVTFDGAVWSLVGPAQPGALTGGGSLTTDLGTGQSNTHDAYVSGQDGLLYVATGDGGYMAFERVVRTMGRTEYGLRSDAAIEYFGEWPELPGWVPAPEDPDGSPVFMRFGFDDRNVDIYTLRPYGIERGFAVAPGTAPDDPAAGNPNWTWWEKL